MAGFSHPAISVIASIMAKVSIFGFRLHRREWLFGLRNPAKSAKGGAT
jgi:hypothetical protein